MGGFADTSSYEFSFANGGKIEFDAELLNSDSQQSVSFRFEYWLYPDTEPSFETVKVQIGETGKYTVDIPQQNPSHSYASVNMYLSEREVPVPAIKYHCHVFQWL